ncbi:MAG: glucose-1-phosphate thymidylyltransferase [Parasphingorhabdus sp.]
MTKVLIGDFIAAWSGFPFAGLERNLWKIPSAANKIIAEYADQLDANYVLDGNVAVHKSSKIEENVTLKGNMIIGPNCLVASGSYLRGGVFLEGNVIIGPNCEVKTTFICSGSKIAHLSFVGDSIVGSNVNIEAGAIVANYRNELKDKSIRIERNNRIVETGVSKFGAIIGDGVRIGANAVISPGTVLNPGEIIRRLQLVDQHPGNI